MIITKAIGASGAFFRIIDSETVATSGISDQEAYSRANIIFHNVSFAYPTRPTIYALNGFSATLETGKTTALVGPSGSGKSTVVALIERWYHLEETIRPNSTDARPPGELTVANHHITELDLKWWRSQIGLVQQEPFLFNESIYNNVAFGLIGSKWENESEYAKMELVMKACKEAFADEFITRLPLVSLKAFMITTILEILTVLTIMIGLLNHRWGRWNHPKRWTAPATRHCTKHSEKTADPDI